MFIKVRTIPRGRDAETPRHLDAATPRRLDAATPRRRDATFLNFYNTIIFKIFLNFYNTIIFKYKDKFFLITVCHKSVTNPSQICDEILNPS